ncbi:AI-2E family transporter [Sulfitobacter guttiformis]|uniref:Putative PurR-regulated permease PerM n=1 Tax=Sulfitobacter guttiformis TaxID=74349 RepID=A0A420DJG0_9RHOB|nr:AI-2E family transporter [Sulfitobacter guttiformis]KIN71804.1 Membrane transporter [Sulfitobacter guttiformis KCTC 32187]RKE94380.1 putative PurR-regulated permease PerM [Sulfitobacter guttiformis]
MEDLTSIRRSLQFLCVIALFVTAYFAKDLILPVLLGFLLALTLSPLSRALGRAGISNGVSAALLVGMSGSIILLLMGTSASTIALWSDELPSIGAQVQSKLRGMADTVETVRRATEEVEKMGESAGAAQEVVVKQPGLLSSAMSTGMKLGGTMAVTLILALFLLASGNMFYLKLVQSFQTLSGKKRALSAVYDVERRISRYLLTITVINAVLGVFVGLFLWMLGLPGAHIFGVAAFLLNFLPYIGGVIGAVLAGAYAIISFDTVGYALLAPIGYMFLTTMEGQLITPWLVGKRLELNTVAVFLTVVLWGWLWGIAGALIAVPFLVVFKVVCENVTALHIFSNFLDNRVERTDLELGRDVRTASQDSAPPTSTGQ